MSISHHELPKENNPHQGETIHSKNEENPIPVAGMSLGNSGEMPCNAWRKYRQ